VRPQSDPVPARGTATFVAKSVNRKLVPIELVATAGRPRPRALGPFVCITNTSIAATSSCACPFKGPGCYVQEGFTTFNAARLDQAAKGHTADEVIVEEVCLIDRSFGGRGVPQDGARGGRDLRLHFGGDVGSVAGAHLLGAAAVRWLRRGGGQPRTYTHWWREIPREAWGPAISVLASVETAADVERARDAGYPAAIVVEEFPSDRAYLLPGSSARIIPCPADTRGVTCATCRLCIDRDLLGMNAAIAFAARGSGKKKVVRSLLQIGRKTAATVGRTRAAKVPK
jgi:hypothetical protein